MLRGTGSRQPGWFDAGKHQLDQELNVELLKLHPGLVRNIEKERRTSCWFKAWWKPAQGPAPGLRHRCAFAKRVADPDSARFTGGQGDFFASSQPLDTNVKNIHKDTRFNLPFNPFSRRITALRLMGVCLSARQIVAAHMR